MKAVVVLSCLVGVAVCYPWGLPQPVHDTPEVAAAKAAHLAAHAHAKYTHPSVGAEDRSWGGAGAEDDGSWKGDGDDGSYKDDASWKHYDDGSWKGDAISWSGNDGSWGGNEHSSNHVSTGHHWGGHEKKWNGPIAYSPGYDKHGAPLPVLDTAEVAAEKSKHFHLYAHAAAHAAHSHAVPVWAPHNAAPADTPEVEAAKSAHFAAHAERRY